MLLHRNKDLILPIILSQQALCLPELPERSAAPRKQRQRQTRRLFPDSSRDFLSFFQNLAFFHNISDSSWRCLRQLLRLSPTKFRITRGILTFLRRLPVCLFLVLWTWSKNIFLKQLALRLLSNNEFKWFDVCWSVFFFMNWVAIFNKSVNLWKLPFLVRSVLYKSTWSHLLAEHFLGLAPLVWGSKSRSFIGLFKMRVDRGLTFQGHLHGWSSSRSRVRFFSLKGHGH